MINPFNVRPFSPRDSTKSVVHPLRNAIRPNDHQAAVIFSAYDAPQDRYVAGRPSALVCLCMYYVPYVRITYVHFRKQWLKAKEQEEENKRVVHEAVDVAMYLIGRYYLGT